MAVPIDLKKWISENESSLCPPVNNRCIQLGKDFIVMVIGGPNERSDYHINETEEWFYQLKGAMLLKTVDPKRGTFEETRIEEGEILLLPGGIPHNPVRFADTIGIVIERIRQAEHIDRLRWYCQQCHKVVYEEAFHCHDIQTQLKEIIERYAKDAKFRTCPACHHVNPPF